MAVMFSKNHAKPAPKDTASVAAGRVHGHEPAEDSGAGAGLERRPAPEPAAGAGAETAQRAPPAWQRRNPAQPGGAAPAAQLPPPATEPPRDPVADAEKALAFKARFASNLVSADDGASRPSAESADLAESMLRLALRACRRPLPRRLHCCSCRDWQQACAGGERQLRARPALCGLRGHDHRHGAGESSGRRVCRAGEGHGDQSHLQPGPPASA